MPNPAPIKSVLLCVICVASSLGLAQKRTKAGYDLAARATVVHPTIVYLAADDTSGKLAEVLPGHELVVIQRNGPWIKVFANTETPDALGEDDTPDFSDDATAHAGLRLDQRQRRRHPADAGRGQPSCSARRPTLEDLAERPHAPKDAASEAHFLYRRVFEYFATSPLAGESAFRSADIRWQLDKAANADLPSTHEQEAYLRPAALRRRSEARRQAVPQLRVRV